MSYLPDYFDAPPETDPAPVRCPMCRSAEACDCGMEPDGCDSCNGAGEALTLRSGSWLCELCLEKRLDADHRRRGGEG